MREMLVQTPRGLSTELYGRIGRGPSQRSQSSPGSIFSAGRSQGTAGIAETALHALDLADAAVEHQFAGHAELLHGALHGAGLQDAVVGIDGPQDFDRLVDVVRQRLFAIDVLAGPQGGQGDEGMPMVGRGDAHGVDVVAADDLAEVVAAAQPPCPPCGHRTGRPVCLASLRRVVSTSQTASTWTSLPRKPPSRPRDCVPMPMKPIVSRELGLTAADQTRDGRRYGVKTAAAAERFKKDRREVFMSVFSVVLLLALRVASHRFYSPTHNTPSENAMDAATRLRWDSHSSYGFPGFRACQPNM